MQNQFVVVKVIDEYTVVINKGSEDVVSPKQRFLIYSLDGEEIIDPITKKSLGILEIVRGTATVSHIQPHLTTLKSDCYTKPSRKITKTNNPLLGSFSNTVTEESTSERELIPFDNPNVGDFAKPTN